MNATRGVGEHPTVRMILRAVLALVLLATVTAGAPAHAASVALRKNLKDAHGATRGCYLRVDTVTRDYHRTYRNVVVKGVLNCQTDGWASKSLWLTTMDPYERSFSTLALKAGQRKNPFKVMVNCNFKNDGVHWDYPKKRIVVNTEGLATRKRTDNRYVASIDYQLPFRC
ncbi:MAG TPA: hypothetical protein VMT88_04475 [Actinomycetes bacterium]|nr:hypothetical protein [Actinomycetes bacterium]